MVMRFIYIIIITRLTVVFMMRLLLGEWSESDFSGGWFLVCFYIELPAGKMVSGQCSAVVRVAGAQWSGDNREQGVYFCNHSNFNLLPFLLYSLWFSLFLQSLLFDSFQRPYSPFKRYWILTLLNINHKRNLHIYIYILKLCIFAYAAWAHELIVDFLG